jgi:hypothetical protein
MGTIEILKLEALVGTTEKNRDTIQLFRDPIGMRWKARVIPCACLI